MSKLRTRLILIILFFLPSYLIKIKFGWASFNVLELLIGIIFFLWIFDKNTKYKIPDTKYALPIVLIFIGLALSVVANKNYYAGLGAIKGWFLFPIIFGIIFYDALKKDERLLKKTFLTFFFSGVAVSIVGIIYKILGVVTFDDRLKIFWDSPNQLAMFLAVPFLIGIWLAIPRPNLGGTPRFGLGIGLALIAANLYATFSYGAWLALAIALPVIFWLKYRKISHKKHLAFLGAVLLIFLVWASIDKYKNLNNLGERSSLASRLAIWKSAGLMIENNPLFGIGPGNFQNKYLEYQKYFPPYLEWSAPQPHNIFLAFWLESGLVGLAGFAILLFYFFRENKIAIRADRDLGILFLGTMLYILVHGLVDTTYWRNDLAVVFWVIIAANIYLANFHHPESPPPPSELLES